MDSSLHLLQRPAHRTFRRRRVLAAAACCAGLFATTSAVAQDGSGGAHGGGRGGRGDGSARPKTNIATARQALLDAATPDVKDLGSLIQAASDESTKRNLPSFNDNPENNYTPEQTAFRKEVYGPLLENPVTRDFLRGLVKKAQTGFDFNAATAAVVLADAPDDVDLDALFAGYCATAAESRTTPARQLGRALGNVRERQPAAARFTEMLDRVKVDATEGKPAQRGSAIEALWRAGETELALKHLEALLVKEADPLESLTVLQACSRLLQKSEVDPQLRARAMATAHTAIEQLLADTAEITPAQAISGKGRMMRSAVAFLQDVGGAHEFDLVLRCLTEPRSQRLLGMDGLQSVRFGLQRNRAQFDAAQGKAVDDYFLKIISEPGARLSSLEEDPMTADEQRAFWDARDLRYNALNYLIDQIRRTKAVKERLGQEKELPEHLVLLFRSKADVKEQRDGETIYRGVQEKLENRVSALELMARMQREYNKEPPGIDLFSEALAILSSEVQSGLVDPGGVIAFRKAYTPHVRFNFAVVKEPADEFVKREAIMTIATLGYVIWTGDGKIGIEVDANDPWPWERDGKPPLTPEKADAKDDTPAPAPAPAPEPKTDGEKDGKSDDKKDGVASGM
jgi:hypothetical protein